MDISGCVRSYPQNAHSLKNLGWAQCSPRAMNPTSNPASNAANPTGYPTRTAQNPTTYVQSPTAYAPDTRAHSQPALLIPEDYRARAVALHARELILRSPQMSAIALGGFSGGFSVGFGGGFGAGVEKPGQAGERPPAEGVVAAGNAHTANAAGSTNTASAAGGGGVLIFGGVFF